MLESISSLLTSLPYRVRDSSDAPCDGDYCQSYCTGVESTFRSWRTRSSSNFNVQLSRDVLQFHDMDQKSRKRRAVQ